MLSPNLEKTLRDAYQLATKNKILFLNVSDMDKILDTDKSSVEIITRAKLPIKKTKNAEIIVFKYNDEPKDYFCILIGKQPLFI